MNDPATNPPGLTLWQKVAISALAGAALALLWHYAGNYLSARNAAALSRFPSLDRKR